jgi:hypothetical protein
MSQASASAPDAVDVSTGPLIPHDLSQAIPTSVDARAKRRVAALEEELETMRQGRGRKQRYLHRDYLSQVLSSANSFFFFFLKKERRPTMFHRAERLVAW